MYKMRTKSAKVGGKEKNQGCTYKYVFEGNGVTFLIHSNPKKNIQPVRIRYNADGLIGRDLFFKHYDTLQVLDMFGFTPTAEKLTRVDMQVMLYLSMEQILHSEENSRKRMVCSAQKKDYRSE
jgi:hypothetical protein